MKLPVYLNTLCPPSEPEFLDTLRLAMFNLCRARWRGEPAADLQVILPEALECPVRDFQKTRRVWAEERTLSLLRPYYVVADDDCLPQAGPFLEDAIEVMEAHPDFAILSLLPTNAEIHPWRPPWPKMASEDSEVMEHHSVGGIRVCRSGVMKEWPELVRPGYDQEHCEAIRGAEYRVGFFKKIKMNHLGEGYSSVWT